jgi:hypothetical protein
MGKVWIAFEKDAGVVPWLIRKFTGFKYNHVLFLYESADWLSFWTSESVSKQGVRSVPLLPHRTVHEKFLLKFDVWPDLRLSQNFITSPYDLLSLLMQAIRISLKTLFRVRATWGGVSLKGLNCSEWIAIVLQNRFPVEFEFPQWATPKDVYDLMLRRTDDFEKEEEGPLP